MNTTLYAFQLICGGIVILLILGLVACGVLALADGLLEKYYMRGQQDQFTKDASRLKASAHWFSEDPATVKLIQSLADGYDASLSRDIWRQEKAKLKSDIHDR